jgi:predicted MFS family arabinose efflux permease
MSQATWDTFNVVMPIYGNAHSFSASQVGSVLGTFSVFTLLVRLGLPAITRRITPWQLLLFSLAGSALTYFGVPLVSSMPPLLALAAWLGIALGVAAPMLLMVIHDASPPERVGEAVGLRVTMMNASQTAIPLAAGGMVALFGLASMFWLFGLVFMSGVWINRDRLRRPRAAGAHG